MSLHERCSNDLGYTQGEIRGVAHQLGFEDKVNWDNAMWPEGFSGHFNDWWNKHRCDVDMARQAYRELHSSHRSLTTARDENSARITQQRDRIWALKAVIERALSEITDVEDIRCRNASEMLGRMLYKEKTE